MWIYRHYVEKIKLFKGEKYMFSSKKSRMFVGLLASATLLAACGSSDDNSKDSSKKESSVELGKAGEFPISEETINMTMMGPNVGIVIRNTMNVIIPLISVMLRILRRLLRIIMKKQSSN